MKRKKSFATFALNEGTSQVSESNQLEQIITSEKRGVCVCVKSIDRKKYGATSHTNT